LFSRARKPITFYQIIPRTSNMNGNSTILRERMLRNIEIMVSLHYSKSYNFTKIRL